MDKNNRRWRFGGRAGEEGSYSEDKIDYIVENFI